MINRIKSLVKNSKAFYKIYSVCGSALLRFAGLFIRTDPNLILFASYGGRKFDDSPRFVYEYLLKHPVSADHKYVWAFIEPEKFPDVPNKIRIDTPRFYLTALKAGYWMTNSSISRGMDFKKKAAINIQFTHGLTALKRIGSDVLDQKDVFVSKGHEKFDLVFVEGKREIPILSKVWHLDEEVFHTTGLPRNDDLVDYPPEEVEEIRKRLGIPAGKKVILYAPTFRDYSKGTDGSNALGIPMDFAKWEKALGQEYVLVVTAHYAVARLLDELPRNDFVINAFAYPVLNDLLKISDILISDYSSIVFDYSILERPILCYGYDCDAYLAMRGSYIDIHSFYRDGVIRDEDALLDTIVNMDYDTHCRFTREQIRDKYLSSYGNAAEKAVEIIFRGK